MTSKAKYLFFLLICLASLFFVSNSFAASSRKSPTEGNGGVSTYGSGKDYAEGTLSTWEQATDLNLSGTASSYILDVHADCGSNLCDDTDTIDGSTTNSTYFRVIRAASGEGHSGIGLDDGTIAGFRRTDANGDGLTVSESNSQLQDLGGKITGSSGSNTSSFRITGSESACVGCIAFDANNTGGGNANGIALAPGSGTTAYCINCLSYNNEHRGFIVATGTGVIVNSTAESNGDEGFRRNSGSAFCINCSTDNNGGDAFTNYTTTTVNAGAAVSYVGAPDFHLVVGDTTNKDNGTDYSDAGRAYAFDDDINDGVMGGGKAGETRSGTWDIGFDEFVAVAGGKPVPPKLIIISKQDAKGKNRIQWVD